MTDTKMKQTVCKFNKTGYCKFSKECKFLHNNDICQGGCEFKKCTKRHPKVCRYQSGCRRKEKCAYKHDSSSPDEELNKQVNSLKSEVKSLESTIQKQKEDIKQMENETKIKLKELNQKVSALKKENDQLQKNNKTNEKKIAYLESELDTIKKRKSNEPSPDMESVKKKK